MIASVSGLKYPTRLEKQAYADMTRVRDILKIIEETEDELALGNGTEQERTQKMLRAYGCIRNIVEN